MPTPLTSRSSDAAQTRKDQQPSAMPPVLQRWGQYILYLLLILFPFASFPPTKVFYNSLDTPRRLLLVLGTGILAALIIKAWSMRRQIVLRWHFLDAYVLLFLLGCVLSSLAGAYPRVSFFGPVWSQDGLILIWANVCLYFGVKEFIRTPEEMERAIALMIYTGGVVAIIGFIDRYCNLGLNPNFDDPNVSTNLRMVSTLGNPMFTATYFCLLVPLGFGLAMATKHQLQRIATLGSTALIFLAMLLTMSRAAWIGLAAAVVVVALLSLWQVARTGIHVSRAALWGTVATLVAIIAIGATNKQIIERVHSITNFDNDTIKTRQIYMQTAYAMFRANPIQGAGVGNLKALFPQYRPYSLVYESGLPLNRGYSTAYPHNVFIQTAGETGLLGLIPFLLLTVLIFYLGFTARRNSPWQIWMAIGLIGVMVAYYVTNMFSFDNAATQAEYWICVSLLAGFTAQERKFFPRSTEKNQETMSWRTASLWNFVSVSLAVVTSVVFLTQFISSVDTQMAANALAATNANMQKNPTDGYRQLDEAVKTVQQGINMSLARDNVAFEILCMGYKIEKDVISDADAKEKARSKMFEAGEEGIRLMDRDPLMLRYMIMEYAAAGTPDALKRGEVLIDKLLRYEPHSSEVRVIQSELHLQEGQLHAKRHEDLLKAGKKEEAELEQSQYGDRINAALKDLEIAKTLDPTFREVYAKIAHDMQLKVQIIEQKQYSTNPAADLEKKRKIIPPMIQQVVNNYATAESMGLALMPFDRLMYAIDLFMMGNIEKGIDQGLQLRDQGPDDFKTLCEKLPLVYQFTGRPQAEFQRVMAQLKTPPPPQPSAEQPNPPAMKKYF